MQIKVILLLGVLARITAGISIDEDADTASVDATTISYIEAPTIIEDVNPSYIETKSKSNVQCTTARGLKGACMPASDCYKIIFTEDGQIQLDKTTRTLAEMLVESSGFCDGSLEARKDITPTLFDQVIRSEVLLCCPERNVPPPDNFKLDNVTMEEDINDEMFKGKSCGYLHINKKDLSNSTDVIIDNSSPEGKIVRGRKTKVGEFPWMVAMMNRGQQFCGASLINQRTVLTAAHCVQHMSASDVKNLRLQIGDWDIYKTSDTQHVVRSVSAVKYHKGFSMKHLQHDIALLILEKPVDYTDTIQPVCLHPGNPPVDGGKERADVAGWGALSEGGGQPSDLRAVNVRVITKKQCQSKYSGSANKVTDGMVCAGSDRGEDSCQGDSGGPLTMDSRNQAKQIGIVSWGIGCGRYPGVYTAVYRYLSWINTNMVK